MSYNISTWHIRTIHLELPIDFDFRAWLQKQPERDAEGNENIGRQWCLEDEENTVKCNLAANTWELTAMNSFLSGSIYDQKLVLSDPQAMEWESDFSGYLYDEVLLPLFKEFKGDLDARVVWERGDTVRQLTIVQGAVNDEVLS